MVFSVIRESGVLGGIDRVVSIYHLKYLPFRASRRVFSVARESGVFGGQ